MTKSIPSEMLPRFWRTIASAFLGCMALALVMFVGFHFHARWGIAALVSLLPIVVLSLEGRFFVALLCSVLADLGLDYFFIPPTFSLAAARSDDIAALLTFLVIAVFVALLGYKARKSYWRLVQENAERKRAEEQQRYQMELLKTVTDNTSSMLFFVDAAGVCTFANPAFERITGYRPEQVIGQIVHDKIHHTKPDGTPYPLHECPLSGTARTGKAVHGEDLFVRKDGTFFPAQCTASPIFREGAAVGAVIEVHDLTESKRAEEARLEALEQLAHVTRVATLGELMTSIAHEINQPLAAIANNAGACVRWLGLSSVEQARQSASLALSDAHRASEVVRRIRALAKKAPPQKTSLDLNDAIREAIAFVHNELKQNGVSLTAKLSKDLPRIMGDRIQLQQVILNLLINATEAMSGVTDGVRELSVHSEELIEFPDEPQHACLATGLAAERQTPNAQTGLDQMAKACILVSIADSGPGLDPDTLDCLFDAFYTTKDQGLGMGLAISRSIIEAHGGRLWATANVPRGAVFKFALPAELA